MPEVIVLSYLMSSGSEYDETKFSRKVSPWFPKMEYFFLRAKTCGVKKETTRYTFMRRLWEHFWKPFQPCSWLSLQKIGPLILLLVDHVELESDWDFSRVFWNEIIKRWRCHRFVCSTPHFVSQLTPLLVLVSLSCLFSWELPFSSEPKRKEFKRFERGFFSRQRFEKR